ncbi:hypothetical protein [Anaeromicropila herbilytica]|uniref:Uncharacterized protein n=1 Tax=Anaeromicropila herbilytica TaxID=2785025 RepID=A0A7R7ENW7_9FIRM|nr:hypothetical protein [Anaeromicropila herbilytica]BCN32204.1 hypothetical protein bsdtb5_34990 [Anaeromicropila herbilytica]
MILKCIKEISREGLSVGRVYPVIGYKIDTVNETTYYQIIDDDRAISWRQSDRFVVLSSKIDNYINSGNEKTSIKYVYKEIADYDIINGYYSENDSSTEASYKLENILISIMANELSLQELMSNLSNTGFHDENSEMLLKTFFMKANKQDIMNIAEILYNNVFDLDTYIIQLVVKNLVKYKEVIIEDLFIELYMKSTSCDEETLSMIKEYLEIE